MEEFHVVGKAKAGGWRRRGAHRPCCPTGGRERRPKEGDDADEWVPRVSDTGF